MAKPVEGSVRGACSECGKAYKLPNANKVFHCKACGGEVYAEGYEDEFEEFDDSESEASPLEERQRHRRDLQVYRKLTQLRTGSLVTGPLAVLAALVYWTMLPSMNDAKLYELSGGHAYLTLTGVAQAGAAIVAAVATLFLLSQPMLASWIPALAQCAAAGVAWFAYTQGGYELWGLVFSLIAAAQLGLAMLVDADTRAALREEPDFFEQREAEARSHARERHEDRPVAHWVPVAKAWGLTGLIAAGGFFSYRGLTAKPSYAASSASFVSAFQSGNLPTLTRFFADQAKSPRQFEEYAVRNKWVESGWPKIQEVGVLERPDLAYVTYADGERQLVASWQWVGDEWKLGGFGTKGETFAAVEKALIEHRKNWRENFAELAEVNARFVDALAAGALDSDAQLSAFIEDVSPVATLATELDFASKGWPKLSVIEAREPAISVWGGEVSDTFRVDVTYAGAGPELQGSWARGPQGWRLFSLQKAPKAAN